MMIRMHSSGRWCRMTVRAKEPLRFFLSLLVANVSTYNGLWSSLQSEVRELALDPEHWVVLWVHERDVKYLKTLPLLFR